MLTTGQKLLREMNHEIADRHFARGDEGGEAGEQADRDQQRRRRSSIDAGDHEQASAAAADPGVAAPGSRTVW